MELCSGPQKAWRSLELPMEQLKKQLEPWTVPHYLQLLEPPMEPHYSQPLEPLMETHY